MFFSKGSQTPPSLMNLAKKIQRSLQITMLQGLTERGREASPKNKLVT